MKTWRGCRRLRIAAGVTLVFAGICPPVYRISRFGAATPPATRPSAMMVRTGLRLTEQASLTLFEVPDVDEHRAYSPTRLPAAIAKNGSGRRIYIPPRCCARFGTTSVSTAPS